MGARTCSTRKISKGPQGRSTREGGSSKATLAVERASTREGPRLRVRVPRLPRANPPEESRRGVERVCPSAQARSPAPEPPRARRPLMTQPMRRGVSRPARWGVAHQARQRQKTVGRPAARLFVQSQRISGTVSIFCGSRQRAWSRALSRPTSGIRKSTFPSKLRSDSGHRARRPRGGL